MFTTRLCFGLRLVELASVSADDLSHRATATFFDKLRRYVPILVDTAYDYENQAQIAAGIKASGVKSSDLFITSKIPCAAYTKAKKEIEENLKELGVEMVDLMLIHTPHCGLGSISQTWRALTEAKAAGKIRAIGVSSFSQSDIEQLSTTPAINQCSYSVEQHDDKIIDYCKSKGITYQSYSPLCGGANGSSCSMQGGKSVLLIPEVKTIATAHNVSAAQVALKWITQRGSPLACASWRTDYMNEDLNLWSWGNLTASDMNTLNKVHPGAISSLP
jgi:diketogulonate reductase-like aldo/keto reductase